MKKFVVAVILTLIIATGVFIYNIILVLKAGPEEHRYQRPEVSQSPAVPMAESSDYNFSVYVEGDFDRGFEDYQMALNYANTVQRSAIYKKGAVDNMWDNYPPYIVYTSQEFFEEFATFSQAVDYAREHKRSFIYYRKDNSQIWTNADKPQKAHAIPKVPLILQNPELPKGCEVTSLTMLINYKGIPVDKMVLADKIKKDDTFIRKNGVVISADPYNGYVGDMKSVSGFGYGVYHGPVHQLLTEYFPKSSLDLTGCEFEDLFHFINRDNPVWVIINSKYAELPEESFMKWNSSQGEISITYSEHSVLVVGYDDENIYFNDPLGEKQSAPLKDFKAAWIQMGSQAVTTSI